jgi:hypothetical protein
MHFPRRSALNWTNPEKPTWRKEADSSRSSPGARPPFSMQRRFRRSRTNARGPTHSRSREMQPRALRRSRSCRKNQRQIQQSRDTSYRALGEAKWSNRQDNYRRRGYHRQYGNHQTEIRRTRGNCRRQSRGIHCLRRKRCPRGSRRTRGNSFRRPRGNYRETRRRETRRHGSRHRHDASRRL